MKAMFANIDGVDTPRPKGQDIRPKVFKDKPWPLAIIAFSEPTDRYVLWFISNYKYAFNVFFQTDFARWMNPPTGGDLSKWPLYKYQVVLKSLMDRHLVEYGDKKRLTLKITLKGQIYRIYTHSTFNFWAITLGVLLAAFGIFKDDIFNSKKTNIEDNKTKQTVERTSDSSLLKIQPLKDSGSFLIDSGKSKTKFEDTAGNKTQIIKSTERH